MKNSNTKQKPTIYQNIFFFWNEKFKLIPTNKKTPIERVQSISFIILTFFILISFNCNESPKKPNPSAIQGVLDLRDWDFEKDGVVQLKGEWEFYWNELLDPNNPISSPKEADPNKNSLEPNSKLSNEQSTQPKSITYLTVPSQWNKLGYPINGYATYRLRILLPKNFISNEIEKQIPLSIKILSMGSNYALFLNGEKIMEDGKVGTSVEESIPSMVEKYSNLNKSILNKSTKETKLDPIHEIELLVHISNFNYTKSGIWNSITLGTEIDLSRQRITKQRIELITLGILGIMSIYHFGLFFQRKKDKSTLYFGLFCFFILLRTISMGERLILEFLPFVSFPISFKFEFLGMYLGAIAFFYFVRALFPLEVSNRIFWTISIPIYFFSFIVIFFPMKIFGHTLLPVQILIGFGVILVLFSIIIAIKNKRDGAGLFLIGFSIFAFFIFHDLYKSIKSTSTPFLLQYGLLIYIFFQATLISKRFSNAFQLSEDQREIINASKREIETLSRTKDEFLANLSHELKTPLSIVFAYSQMLPAQKDNPKKIEKYADQIFSNASKLNDYVSDLILVTDIESNLILQKTSTDINLLIEECITILAPLAESKSLRIEKDFYGANFLMIDPALFKKAFLAVFKNAILYNKPSGFIKVQIYESDSFFEVSVQDSGFGISTAHKEKIFDKFYRVDSTINYEVSGVGIGLYLSKKIVEMHNGKIDLRSNLGDGSTFILSFKKELSSTNS
jgi:two-component system, sensor histidine kinase ChiS